MGRQNAELAYQTHRADSLAAELKSVRGELDDIKFGPERLLALAKAALERKSYDEAVSLSKELSRRHPNAPEVAEGARLVRLAETAKEQAAAETRRRAEAAARAEKERAAQALRNMRSFHDEVRDLTLYFDRNVSRYVNTGGSRLLLYIAKPASGTPNLFFSLRYQADEWLFVQSYTIKADDRTFTISPSYGEVERDNGYGGIWEWYTTAAGTHELEIVRAVIRSARTIIRYNGQQYYRDRTVTAGERQSMQNVLDAYDALKAGGSASNSGNGG